MINHGRGDGRKLGAGEVDLSGSVLYMKSDGATAMAGKIVKCSAKKFGFCFQTR